MELNDTVSVILTKEGADILNKSARNLNEYFQGSIHFKDNYLRNEYYETQLWNLFREFGDSCSAGSTIVFTNLEKVNK